jgi:hypothetical protein
MKMLEMQVGQLAGQPMGDKEEYPRQPQGPKTARLLKLIWERWRIALRRP